MSDSQGTFEGWKKSETPCRICSGVVLYRLWESSCGGYEDYNFKCKGCGKDWWVEGADA